jgi:predicted dehydrogenase
MRQGSMSKLKAAIVGCGFVAQKRHIPGFLRLKHKVSLCALCDLNQGLAAEVASKFGIRHIYSSVSEMLSKEDLDIVDICTPPNAHSTVAIEALERGCSVLMEKPMALTVSDCDKMINSARSNGGKLSVVHNQRFYPPFIKAKELVAEGTIGKMTGMRVLSLTNKNEYMTHESHWVHKLPGGVIGEVGPHTVYMSLAFMGGIRDVDVRARKTLDYPWVLYDNYQMELEGEHMDSSVYVSNAGDYWASEVDLFGTDSVIKMDLESMLLTHSKLKELKPTSVALYSLGVAGQMIEGVASNAFRMISDKPMLGHYIMIEKYVDSVLDDKPVPVTPEEGRETIRVMGMIVEKLGAH